MCTWVERDRQTKRDLENTLKTEKHHRFGRLSRPTVKMLMELGNLIHNYDQKREAGNEAQLSELQNSILKIVQENDMAQVYTSVSERFGWAVDETLLNELKRKNEEELASIEANIVDAGINRGDMEVTEAQHIFSACFVNSSFPLRSSMACLQKHVSCPARASGMLLSRHSTQFVRSPKQVCNRSIFTRLAISLIQRYCLSFRN